MARVALGPTAMAAAVVVVALAGCGGAAHSSSSSRSATAAVRPRPVALTVTPRSGGAQTAFRFVFTAPASSGVQGRTALSYSLSVAGPARAGCVGVRSAPVAAVIGGHRSTTPLGPGQLGARWCIGAYTAKVAELVRPVCAAGEVCPQFIRLVAIIGPAGFTITR